MLACLFLASCSKEGRFRYTTTTAATAYSRMGCECVPGRMDHNYSEYGTG